MEGVIPETAFAAPLPGFPDRPRQIALKALLRTFGPLLTIDGAERLARVPEPALFALNHSNAAEALLVPAALFHLRGRPIHFLADWMYLEIPLVGSLLRLGEPIPVYGKRARFGFDERRRRERARQPVWQAGLALLAAGASVGIFPEGTRNPDPHRLLPGRGGLGEMVLGSTAPVVPIGLRYPAAGRRGRRGRPPLLGRTVVKIGEPLAFAPERALWAGIADEPGWSRTRKALGRRIVGRVMERLGELCGKRPAEP
jgi:1-acyl-sn-glycerol-3-phosphate acyltransferase